MSDRKRDASAQYYQQQQLVVQLVQVAACAANL
jgi:hypothetical protein